MAYVALRACPLCACPHRARACESLVLSVTRWLCTRVSVGRCASLQCSRLKQVQVRVEIVVSCLVSLDMQGLCLRVCVQHLGTATHRAHVCEGDDVREQDGHLPV